MVEASAELTAAPPRRPGPVPRTCHTPGASKVNGGHSRADCQAGSARTVGPAHASFRLPIFQAGSDDRVLRTAVLCQALLQLLAVTPGLTACDPRAIRCGERRAFARGKGNSGCRGDLETQPRSCRSATCRTSGQGRGRTADLPLFRLAALRLIPALGRAGRCREVLRAFPHLGSHFVLLNI
jgi:hypothetical protein